MWQAAQLLEKIWPPWATSAAWAAGASHRVSIEITKARAKPIVFIAVPFQNKNSLGCHFYHRGDLNQKTVGQILQNANNPSGLPTQGMS
jgi:hypothetical protein